MVNFITDDFIYERETREMMYEKINQIVHDLQIIVTSETAMTRNFVIDYKRNDLTLRITFIHDKIKQESKFISNSFLSKEQEESVIKIIKEELK